MTDVLVHPDEATMPVASALKNLAKVHDLPPFVKLYQSQRTAVVVVHRKYAKQWQAAVGAGPFVGDGVLMMAEAFWMGAQVKIAYGARTRA